MRYRILLHPKALKALRSVHPEDATRIKSHLRQLEKDPFSRRSAADIKRLRGTKSRQDLYRIRIGKFRAINAVVGDEVLVTDLFERGAGYEV